MASRQDPWHEWQEKLSSAGDNKELLKDRLLEIAEDVHSWLGERRSLELSWRHLGIHVVARPLPTSGSCSVVDGKRIVVVNRNEGPNRQHFTAAHEAGHLLLSKIQGFSLRCGSPASEEEKLCDEFASAVLVPPSVLRDCLDKHGEPETPRDLLRFCALFRVNLQPMLIALSGSLAKKNRLALVARYRGHPQRPAEIGYRAESNSGRPEFFIPRDQRLSSIGLHKLVEWASNSFEPGSGAGEDEDVKLKLWSRNESRRTGTAVGPVPWEAHFLGGSPKCLLAFLKTDRLRHRWARNAVMTDGNSSPSPELHNT